MNSTFVQSLQIKNLLSYGEEGEEIELRPLNVLIGPNASGKSNFIEAIGLLKEIPKDLAYLIRREGGVSEWLWKGGRNHPEAELEAVVSYPEATIPGMNLRYRIKFTEVGQRLELIDEVVENQKPNDPDKAEPYFFYRYQNGNPVLNIKTEPESPIGTTKDRTQRRLRREDLIPDQSVLSQRKDPDLYPELTYLSDQFSRIRLYREWNLGRNTEPRRPRQTDEANDFLEEDASNLALVLNELENRPKVHDSIIKYLQKFYDVAKGFSTKVEGGTIQLYVREEGLSKPIPATRLSDGTLRYLCLLSILCHPTPPPLICIEEPELGLHPDILSTIAELLIEASQRTQLIVTTHSDALVSALSEIPESVLVCEHYKGKTKKGSSLKRLTSDQLQSWLEKYTLGDLWRMGQIGGNRW